METPRIVNGSGARHNVAGAAAASNTAMVERARMFRRWADGFPEPVAHACRRRACELTLMAEVAAAAG
jgi:hypothetical protein